MTSPTGELAAAAAVEAMVAQQAAAAAQLTERTLLLLSTLWSRITDHRDREQLELFATRAATVIRSAETTTGRVTEAYLRRVLRALGITVPTSRLVELPESLRFGVPLEEIVVRPAATVRYLRSVDTPPAAAREAGAARLQALGETHIQLAQRQATSDVVRAIDAIRGYRRVLRPELSEGGSCGLCIAAADRKYGKAELLPIHDKCKCTVLPITRRQDPGLRLNDEDLRVLYSEAGGTTGKKLKRVRYRVEQHGELGPVLVPQGRRFRTAADAGESVLGTGRTRAEDPAQREASYRAQLTTFEASIPALERRAAAGEDVAAPLAWQRARAEELRRQLRGRAAA